MARRAWGAAVCLDCAAEIVGMCATCLLARKAAGYRGASVNVEAHREKWRDYQREYRAARKAAAERRENREASA